MVRRLGLGLGVRAMVWSQGYGLPGSGVAEVCEALTEVGGLGPLASTFFSFLWGPLAVRPKGNHHRLRHYLQG